MTPTYPGVYILEPPSPVHTIVGVATSIAAFVGYTGQGIDNRAQQIFSFSDFERLYGGLAADSELSYAVQQFFANGGTEAYVVRVPRAGSKSADVTFTTQTATWTFQALSRGTWANGNLLLDVDLDGLSQSIPGTLNVQNGQTAIVGTGTSFTALQPGQWLIFSGDGTHTPYEIKSIIDDTHLTLNSNFGGANLASTAAIVFDDPTAFNLGIRNLQDSTEQYFPNLSLDSTNTNFIGVVLNDPDTGSQVVNVTSITQPTANAGQGPRPTGVVGTSLTLNQVLFLLLRVNLAGTVTLTANSTAVAGTNTKFTTLNPGQRLVFSSDTTFTPYTIAKITDDTNLTLTSNYSGTVNNPANPWLMGATANADFGLVLGVSDPSPAPGPLPITIPVFRQNGAVSQTLAGLATQLQTAINATLAVQMPGASVFCAVAAWRGTQAIRVAGSIPNYPDAIFTFGAPASGQDAAGLLGLSAPTSSNVGSYALGTGHVFGAQTGSNPGNDGTGLPGSLDLIGDPAANTGIYALQKVDLFNLLSIPDATRASAGDAAALDSTVDPNAIYGAAITLCDTRRAFLLIDPPPNINNVAAAVDWKTTLLTVHDENGAAYFPRLRLPDPLNGFKLRTFAPSGVVAGLYGRIDSTRGVWKAPAGTQATLSGVQALIYKLNDPENGVLNPLGLNCSRTFPIYGSVMWGARTLVGADADASQWKYVPVRRTALYIEESLYRGTQWVVFEPNDEPLWASIRLNVGAFMNGLFRKQAFQGKTPDEAYFVKCDSDTTTQNDIDLGIVNVLVGFAPLKPAEFVIIKISQISGQVQT
jgi:uncharacterized protein